ncbi:MAG: hypothetical protein LE178_06205 [Endomicrobium sp.]|nr:hypothetical protein [Endomicrobium sp.]
MKDFKKAISVVVLFSFVFSACGKNANLERGNLIAAAVITPSTTAGENNSQKEYKDELGGFTKPKSVSTRTYRYMGIMKNGILYHLE